MPAFQAKQIVEVDGDQIGLIGCWLPAVVINIRNNSDKAVVRYLEKPVDNGDKLDQKEEVEVARLRPEPMSRLVTLASVKVGDVVEAHHEACWRRGTVVSATASAVTVALKGSRAGSREILVSNPQLLRPSVKLEGGLWRRILPGLNHLLALGFPKEVALETVKATEEGAQWSAPLGPPRFETSPAGKGRAARGKESKHSEAAGGKRKRQSTEQEEDDEEEEEADGDEEDDEDDDDEDDEYEERRRRSAGAGPSSATAPNLVDLPQRSRRERKSRIVYVNNVPVLKDNLYDINDFDTKALRRRLAAGETRIEGLSTKPQHKPQPKAKPQAKPEPKQQAQTKPRSRPAGVVALVEHNNKVRQGAQECEVRRAQYLLEQLDKLRPFITSKVEAHIRKLAASAPVADRPQVVEEQPAEILAVLREYQLAGLSWLVAQWERGINAILADEMGLGKTLQTISFLAHLKYVRHVEGPHLVVVPLSVLSSWMSEFKKWCPSMRVVQLHSNDVNERKRLCTEVLSRPNSFDVAITTYEMVNSQHFGNSIKQLIVWRYLVLDEAHRIKNEEAQVSAGARHIRRQHVLMITGTPIQNNLHELYALLNFMYPDIFTEPELFDAAFNAREHKVDKVRLDAAHYLLRPLMLRRLKSEVEVSLPPMVETRIHCPLSDMQTFWYRRLLLRDSRLLLSMEADAQKVEGGGDSWKRAMNLLMQLRKVCNHPFMFPDAEPTFDCNDTNVPEEIVTGSGKMMVLDRLLSKLKAKGHRVVLFSQFNIMLDILEDYIRARGYKYRRLDGSTNRIQRKIDMEMFNKPNSDVFIFMLSTRAGGLGLNLQTADTCILFDSDWNPQWDLQAMARVHRIGQTRPVHTYRLVSEGTVEDRIQRRAETKLYLDQMVNRGSTSAAEELERLGASELLSMLRFGADRIFRNEAGAMPSEEELDRIVDRSRMLEAAGTGAGASGSGTHDADAAAAAGPSGSGAETAAAAPADGAAPGGGGLVECKRTARDFNAEAPLVDSFKFDGKDFRVEREAKVATLGDIAKQYWEGKKRERRARLIDIDGFQVLRENNYTMEEGMKHEKDRAPAAKQRVKHQRAGTDYGHSDFCQVCWGSEGEMLCCDYCPAAYHPECLGMSKRELKEAQSTMWSCPHHSCAQCERTTAQAGGLLFRCEMCFKAFCEDNLPDGYEVVGECEYFQALGQVHPRQACFIRCSTECQEFYKEMLPAIQQSMEAAAEEQSPPPAPTPAAAVKTGAGPSGLQKAAAAAVQSPAAKKQKKRR